MICRIHLASNGYETIKIGLGNVIKTDCRFLEKKIANKRSKKNFFVESRGTVSCKELISQGILRF